ncbi:MAG: hypothetical protein Q9170_007310 [Blastenia crenularia]
MNQNLWSLAAAKLEDKDKQHVPHSSLDIDDLRAAASERQRECVQKQWRVKAIGGNNSTVVLREIFAKIVVWVQKFVEVGDVAINYDPGHAALPWALVSIQDVQQYVVVAEGLESVAKTIVLYSAVEKLYLRRSGEESTQLKNALVELYALVLTFLIRAQSFYKEGTINRALKGVFDMRNKFQGRLDAISRQETQVKKYTDLMDARYQKDVEDNLVKLTWEEKSSNDRLRKTMMDLQQPINRMQAQMQDLQDNMERAQRQEILQWLSVVPYMRHHQQNKSEILEGTGQWFLNNNRLLQWRKSSSSSILWLRGMAGSGKSKLISIFLDEQLKASFAGNDPVPAIFYCARNPLEPERADAEAILRSIVRQLACFRPESGILSPVEDLYRARSRNGFIQGPLTFAECTKLIVDLSQCRPLTTIVIDALDECEIHLRDQLFDSLTEILRTSNGLVKVLVSSREERDIACQLDGCLNIEIKANNNQQDINRFVDHELNTLISSRRLLYGKVDDDLRRQIARVLCEKASGMFRWVSMQLQFLRTVKLPAVVRKRLGELPRDLREAYEQTYQIRLESYLEEQRLITQNAFKLLLSLQISFSQWEFLHALSFSSEDKLELSSEELLDLCSGFIVLDANSNRFRFAHLSVREYLESNSEYAPEANHAVAAQYCLRYLCTSNVSGISLMQEAFSSVNPQLRFTRLQENTIDLPWNLAGDSSFVDKVQAYACLYWVNHVVGARQLRLANPLMSLFRDFIMDDQQEASPWFTAWNNRLLDPNRVKSGVRMGERRRRRRANHKPSAWNYYHILATTHDPADYLFLACLFGFHEILDIRLRSDPDPLEVVDKTWEYNALQLACHYGLYDTVEVLLDRGFNINIRSGNQGLLMVTMKGTAWDFEIEVPAGSIRSRRPLKPCLEGSMELMRTIELLLVRSASTNSSTFYGCLEGTEIPLVVPARAQVKDQMKYLLAYLMPDGDCKIAVEDHPSSENWSLMLHERQKEMGSLPSLRCHFP